MTRFDDDVVLRAALAPARDLEPTQAEVARALTASRTVHRRAPRRVLVIAVSAMALLSGGAYAVPVTRAAIDDVFGTFAGWIDGDDSHAPGRAVRPDDDAPTWVRESGAALRLVAHNDGVKLYALRTPDGKLAFALNGSVGIQDSLDGWRNRFKDHAIVVLGPGGVDGRPLDPHGRRPLFGVTARSVTRIQLRYTTGPPLTADRLRGGFVLLADPRRAPREIGAYNAAGRELDRTNISYIDLRTCADQRGCPPGNPEP
jgi:hypothetical protein